MATLTGQPLRRDERSFLPLRAQPAMTGLIDGSLSTLAPVFAVAFATHQPAYAFFAGLATAIGAGVSMAFSEGLSATGPATAPAPTRPAQPSPQRPRTRSSSRPATQAAARPRSRGFRLADMQVADREETRRFAHRFILVPVRGA
jgi:hypothetical protein